jgi:hypothetical protein
VLSLHVAADGSSHKFAATSRLSWTVVSFGAGSMHPPVISVQGLSYRSGVTLPTDECKQIVQQSLADFELAVEPGSNLDRMPSAAGKAVDDRRKGQNIMFTQFLGQATPRWVCELL